MTLKPAQNLAELSDEALAVLAQQGDKDAFGALARRYEPKLMRYASRLTSSGDIEAADVVQDALIKAYVNLRSFDPERRFSPWLYRIVHNELINTVRHRARELLDFYDFDNLFPVASKDDLAKETDRALLREEMEKCLAKLPANYREPLVLFAYEGMTYQEISDVLRLPPVTVGVRINRGRNKLKELCSRLKT
jgi:RNA polymerase sigma-70 factor (ECF subfamily)